MLRVISTPWAAGELRRDPVAAMAVEEAVRSFPGEGTLRLFGKSPRGSWLAIVNTPESPADGYRSTHYSRLPDAVAHAVRIAREDAA